MSNRFKLTSSVCCDVGKIRDNHEDNYYLCGTYREDVNLLRSRDEHTGYDDCALFSVCDGMGGQEHGEIASLIAIKHLRPHDMHSVKSEAQKDFLESNQAICDEIIKADGVRMGSTVAALYIDRGKAISGNIGDSRVYLFRDHELNQISEDHDEAARLVKMGVLTPEEAKKDKRRHRLTQHLGLFEDELIPEVYWSELIEIKDGDRFLLCSDGITDMLSDELICEILNNNDNTEKTADLLIEQALSVGGKDNATALVVDVGDCMSYGQN